MEKLMAVLDWSEDVDAQADVLANHHCLFEMIV